MTGDAEKGKGWGEGSPRQLSSTTMGIVATFHPAGTIIRLVERLVERLDAVNWKFTSMGIALQAMDTATIMLASTLLPAENMEFYRCDEPRTVGLSLKTLLTFLHCGHPEDTLTLSCGTDDNAVNVRLISPDKQRIAEFSVAILNLDIDELAVGECPSLLEIEVSAPEFARTVKDIVSVDIGTMEIGIESHSPPILFIRSADPTADISAKRLWKHGAAGIKVDLQVGTLPSRMLYSAGYLAPIARTGTALGSNVHIAITESSLLKIVVPVGSLGTVTFYVSPCLPLE